MGYRRNGVRREWGTERMRCGRNRVQKECGAKGMGYRNNGVRKEWGTEGMRCERNGVQKE